MTLRPGRLAWCICITWLAAWPLMAHADDATPPRVADAEQGGPLEFDPAPEKLEGAPRSEEKQDRLHAAAVYAEGRILSQRGKYAEGLAKYQRAWRYDPSSAEILEDLVPLAVRLDRHGEAARYAVIAVEQGADIDPRTLQNLAMRLSQEQEWKDARVFYKKLYELQQEAQGKDGQPDIGMILVQLELGRINFLLGDYQASAESFALVRDAIEHPEKYHLNDALRKMLLDDPVRTYLLLGEAFLQGGRPDDAEAMFRKVDEVKPQPEALMFRLARVAHARGQTDAALEQLEKYLAAKSSEHGAEPYELLAEILQKKFPDAKEVQQELLSRLDKLYADDPANPGLAYFTADRYVAAGRFEDAEKVYREQLLLNASPIAYTGLIKVYQGLDQPDKLLAALGEGLVQAGSLDAFSDEIEEIGKDEKLADRLIAAAREKRSQGPDALGEGGALAAALVAMEAKKIDAANELFEWAAEGHKPDRDEVLTAWGLGLLFQGEYEQAAEVLQRAIDEQVNPENDAVYYYYLGMALAFADRPDEALTAAMQAAQMRPDNPQFESRVAWINYRAQRYGDAERAYLDLLAKLEENFTREEWRDLVRETKLILSNICIEQDRFDDGVEWLEQVLDEFPNDPGALNDLGYLWSEKGLHLQRSLTMVQKAVEAEPDNAAYQDSLGWALFRLGRTEDALKHLEKAAELQGDAPDGVILDHLGDAYHKLGQKEKAQETWRRAAAAFEKAEDDEELEKVKKKIE